MGELVDLGRLHIPPGVRLVTFGHDLVVSSAVPLPGEPQGLVGLELSAAVGAPDPAALNAAARRALKGRPTSVAVTGHDGGRVAVRLEPTAEGATAVWFDVSGLGISGEAQRERADELAQAFSASRGLARSMYGDEARATICDAASSVCDADHVALFEPDPEAGVLVASAQSGLGADEWELPLGERSSAVAALQNNSPVQCRVAEKEPEGMRRFLLDSGTAAATFQPLSRGRSVRAVLMLGWRQQAGALDARSARLIEFVSIEAAVAIDRGTALGRLVSMARTDALTGLPNRRCWEEELRREIGRARRQGSALVVAMLDLDGFKALNDSAGHQVGDELLSSVAASWRPILRSTDVLARHGGDEFAIALPTCSLTEGRELLARLQQASDRIGFCAGLTAWDPGDERPEDTVARADRALYSAKATAPGTVIVAE